MDHQRKDLLGDNQDHIAEMETLAKERRHEDRKARRRARRGQKGDLAALSDGSIYSTQTSETSSIMNPKSIVSCPGNINVPPDLYAARKQPASLPRVDADGVAPVVPLSRNFEGVMDISASNTHTRRLDSKREGWLGELVPTHYTSNQGMAPRAEQTYGNDMKDAAPLDRQSSLADHKVLPVGPAGNTAIHNRRTLTPGTTDNTSSDGGDNLRGHRKGANINGDFVKVSVDNPSVETASDGNLKNLFGNTLVNSGKGAALLKAIDSAEDIRVSSGGSSNPRRPQASHARRLGFLSWTWSVVTWFLRLLTSFFALGPVQFCGGLLFALAVIGATVAIAFTALWMLLESVKTSIADAAGGIVAYPHSFASWGRSLFLPIVTTAATTAATMASMNAPNPTTATTATPIYGVPTSGAFACGPTPALFPRAEGLYAGVAFMDAFSSTIEEADMSLADTLLQRLPNDDKGDGALSSALSAGMFVVKQNVELTARWTEQIESEERILRSILERAQSNKATNSIFPQRLENQRNRPWWSRMLTRFLDVVFLRSRADEITKAERIQRAKDALSRDISALGRLAESRIRTRQDIGSGARRVRKEAETAKTLFSAVATRAGKINKHTQEERKRAKVKNGGHRHGHAEEGTTAASVSRQLERVEVVGEAAQHVASRMMRDAEDVASGFTKEERWFQQLLRKIRRLDGLMRTEQARAIQDLVEVEEDIAGIAKTWIENY